MFQNFIEKISGLKDAKIKLYDPLVSKINFDNN
jgi:hypothetical protein